MKKYKQTSLSLFVVVLALTAQLSFATPTVTAQNPKSDKSMKKSVGRHVDNRYGDNRHGNSRRCDRSCRRTYRNCLNWAGANGGRRRSCDVRYRNCLRRCSR